MKKPDITPGPWTIEGQTVKGNEENGYICTWSGRKSDAKAMSAVPDILDELIEELNFLHEVLREYGSQELASPVFEEKIWDRIKQIEQALKKAGCTYE